MVGIHKEQLLGEECLDQSDPQGTATLPLAGGVPRKTVGEGLSLAPPHQPFVARHSHPGGVARCVSAVNALRRGLGVLVDESAREEDHPNEHTLIRQLHNTAIRERCVDRAVGRING